jgi:uncharacterized protein (TIGR03437 family)
MGLSMPKLLHAALLAFASTLASGQQLPWPTYLTPKVLFVGSAATATVYNQAYTSHLTALWNGSPRPTTGTTYFAYTVQLTAADLAAPQLGILSMVDSTTGAVVDTVSYPVGYNVQPTGIVLARGRNRLYLATSQRVGDPQFPVNSVVALDVATGKVMGTAAMSSTLGDIALSDDESSLYVVLEGSSIVRRLDPSTLATVADFNFRAAGYKSPYPGITAIDMLAVMPGQQSAVALWFVPDVGSTGTQLAIFDNGVKRLNTLNGCCGSILFSPDGKYLFGAGTAVFTVTPGAGDSQAVTLRYTVDSTGIPNQKPLSASGGAPAIISGGTLYTALATTIDYNQMSVTGNFGISGPITVDPTTRRVFMIYSPPPIDSGGNSPPQQLLAFSLPTLELLGAQPIGVTSLTTLQQSEKLLHFGTDGMIVPSDSGLLIMHTPLAGPNPTATAAGIVNAASQQAGAIAPGEILTIYGANLGPTPARAAVSSGGLFPTLLGGVQVLFGQTAGVPLLASQGQINVVAPFELQPGSKVDLQILYYGIPSATISLPVAAAAPALFTQNGSGRGLVAVINQDGSVNAPSPAGTVVTLYGTGGGVFAGAADGGVPRRPASLSGAVHVTVAGRDAPVIYAGAAPGLTGGAFQFNVTIPPDVLSGEAAIVLNIQGKDSPQGVTLAIR